MKKYSNVAVLGVLVVAFVWIAKVLKDFKVLDLGKSLGATPQTYVDSSNKLFDSLAKNGNVSELAKTSKIIGLANRLDELMYGLKVFHDWFGKSRQDEVFNIISGLSNEEFQAVSLAYGLRAAGHELFARSFGLASKTLTDNLLKYFEGHEVYDNGIKQRLRVAGLM